MILENGCPEDFYQCGDEEYDDEDNGDDDYLETFDSQNSPRSFPFHTILPFQQLNCANGMRS